MKKEETPNSKITLDQLFSKVKSGDLKELTLILKTDVAGSLEAVKGMIEKVGNDEVKVKIIHSAVGGITESDVLLASTANGLIVGFNVRPDTSAARMAKEKGVEIKSYSIIYELVDDLKKAISRECWRRPIVEKVQGPRRSSQHVYGSKNWNDRRLCGGRWQDRSQQSGAIDSRWQDYF